MGPNSSLKSGDTLPSGIGAPTGSPQGLSDPQYPTGLPPVTMNLCTVSAAHCETLAYAHGGHEMEA